MVFVCQAHSNKGKS